VNLAGHRERATGEPGSTGRNEKASGRPEFREAAILLAFFQAHLVDIISVIRLIHI
jgi:hypothetical protein